MAKRTRKTLNLGDKVSLIREVESGVKKKQVAQKFGVPMSTLSTILKNKEIILKNSSDYMSSPERKRIKVAKYDILDKTLMKWISECRDKKLPVSGRSLRIKALEYAQAMGFTRFQASNGWLEKFQHRHGISYKTLSGEGGSSDTMSYDNIQLKEEKEDINPAEFVYVDCDTIKDIKLEEVEVDSEVAPSETEVALAFSTIKRALQIENDAPDEYLTTLLDIENFLRIQREDRKVQLETKQMKTELS